MPKLLLVDDSKEDRFLIRQALAECDFACEVEEACDGEQAELLLSKCIREDTLPEFLILDLNLPKRSGREIVEKLFLSGVTQRTRIVVLSSLVSRMERSRLQKLGVREVCEKPIELDQFLALGRRVKELSSDASPDSNRQREPKG